MNRVFTPEKTDQILVSCLPGLGPVLSTELQDLGFKVSGSSSTFAVTQGNMFDTYRMNLWLRTGSHIYYQLMSFKGNSADELYQSALSFPWEDVLEERAYFSIQSFVKNDSIRDTRFANLRLKDAIVDRFGEKQLDRPNSGPSRDKAVIYLFWNNEDISIHIDTSGNTLSKRGYRENPWQAPLAESLAAGIILSTSWDRKSPFINPMGGSGTLVIEAALIAMGLAPGKYKSDYGFMHIKGYNSEKWNKIKRDSPEPKEISFPIIYNDNKRAAAQAARLNLERAGLLDQVDFQICDFSRMVIPDGPGTLIINPPYGERLGEIDELTELYEKIGDFFKQKCVNYKGYIFSANRDLIKNVGLKAKSRTIFYNAKLEARLLEYEMYEGSRKADIE